ncbi:unnamed protein product [Clonostachys rhizophaga]|uniref:Carboxylic ester hydrolase n=1 Tax=Clonostachys rhizophaga TaxID=160324 RepID=A0A9N9YP15_9HYPO|nr:unnamed protein product [Clonostachys rhizophaga]
MRLNVTISLVFLTSITLASIPPGMEDALTTSNVPAEYLEYVFLLGGFPIIQSRSDPRVSYGVYVPKDHYNELSNSTQDKLPLLVNIHGTSRRMTALQVDDQLPKFADEIGCAVLAPLFPAGIEGPNDISSFKVLHTDSLRSDLALLNILDEVAYRWPGIDTTRIYLSGFSGGGQFAHRFLYLHPYRIAAASIGAPGRVTYPDQSKPWPQGISDVGEIFNTTVSMTNLNEVSLQFVVGEKDTEIHGSSKFWEWLEKVMGSADDLPPMNESRLDTVKKLRDTWTAAGVDSLLTIVPGVAHDSEDPAMRKALWEFLGDQIRTRRSESHNL